MDLVRLQSNLEKRGFEYLYFETGAQAVEYICQTLEGKTVGMGGSVTSQQLGLYEKLAQKSEVFWHWKEKGVQAKAAVAYAYITSANAISESGEIVNIDGTGNRVSAMCYGHSELYIVAGVNKICPDMDSAIDRAKNIAAPLNAMRLNRQTPCALSDDHRCYNCSCGDRICNVTAVFTRPTGGNELTRVIIIGEELGY